MNTTTTTTAAKEEILLEKERALASDAEKGVAIAIAQEVVPVDDPVGEQVTKEGGGVTVEAVGEPVKQGVVEEVKKDVTTGAHNNNHDNDRRKWYIFGGVFVLFCVMAAVVIAIPMRRVADRSSAAPYTGIGGSEQGEESISGGGGGSTNNETGAGGNNGATGSNNNTVEVEDSLITINGPFPTTVRLFGPEILEGYSTAQELEADLVNVSWFLINNVYQGNLISPCWGGGCRWRGGGDFFVGDVMEQNDAMMDSGLVAFAPNQQQGEIDGSAGAGMDMVGGAVPEARDETVNTNDKDDSYGTNNQEDGVEEGDLIISDGEKVYAAYGDYVVAWNARSGRMLSHVRMPSIKSVVAEYNKDNNVDNNGEETASSGGLRDDGGDYGYDYLYYSTPYIRSLLLRGDRLVVIVGGYGQAMREIRGRGSDSILYDFMETQVRVYDTSNLDSIAEEQGNNNDTTTVTVVDELPLLGSMTINGGFNAVRSVGGNVHVVTTSGLDTYRELQSPFDPWNFDEEMTDEEYVTEIKKIAEEKSIPTFVDGLMEELQTPTGKLPNLAKIAAWQSGGSSGSQLERRAFQDGLINNLVQVYSFDVTGDETTTPADASLLAKEKVQVSGTFLPSYWQQVYGTTTDLILAGEGWEYDRWLRASSEGTYLMALTMDGPSTKMRSVGHVPGRVLNSYSMDVVGDTLRIATTLRNMWVMRPIGIFNDNGNGPARDERLEVEQESTTKNYVFTLDLDGTTASSGEEGAEDTAGMITERGRLKLGKPNEVFTSVRYFDNIAYAVTFERTDPFYVLDLNDPDAPEVLAELNITGFSSYLHSMNANNTMILAIGEEADTGGRVLGIKVTVFDVRDQRNPVALQNYVVEQDRDTWSNSEALSNFKAARYAGGRLVIPMSIYNWEKPDENFQGFSVFVVNENEIKEECRISHDEKLFRNMTNTTTTTEEEDGNNGGDGGDNGFEEGDFVGDSIVIDTIVIDAPQCYSCSSLPRRSMMFDGLMMTTDRHLVVSTNTSICRAQWVEPIVIKDPNADNETDYTSCCGY